MVEWVSDPAVVKKGFSGKILLSERPAPINSICS